MSQNLLYKTRCYLVGAMQYANGEDWRNLVKTELTRMNVTVFDPYHKPFINEIKEDQEARDQLSVMMNAGRYDEVAERMKHVRSDDLRLCDLSDFAIVQVIPKVASWGSAEELAWFVRCKKPIFLFVEGGKSQVPLWILGQIPHKYIYNSIHEILDVLKCIDSGEKELDSQRWRLLRKEYR